MNREKLIRKEDGIAIFAVLIILLVIGTFFDYPISSTLYDPQSAFGLMMASYGQAPSSAGAVLAGALFLMEWNREKRSLAAAEIVLGLVMVIVGVYMLCENPVEYMDMPLLLSCVIGVLISAGMAALAAYLVKHAAREDILRAAVAFFLVIALQMALINLIKIPWGRARMRLIATDSRAYFTPWYQPGTGAKDALVAAGVSAEEFKSFPSGHTGHGVMLMLFGLLPGLVLTDEKKERAWKRAFVWLGFTWAALVAFSRMIMGAHFLSDTVVGFAIAFACVWVVTARLYRGEPGKKGNHA